MTGFTFNIVLKWIAEAEVRRSTPNEGIQLRAESPRITGTECSETSSNNLLSKSCTNWSWTSNWRDETRLHDPKVQLGSQCVQSSPNVFICCEVWQSVQTFNSCISKFDANNTSRSIVSFVVHFQHGVPPAQSRRCCCAVSINSTSPWSKLESPWKDFWSHVFGTEMWTSVFWENLHFKQGFEIETTVGKWSIFTGRPFARVGGRTIWDSFCQENIQWKHSNKSFITCSCWGKWPCKCQYLRTLSPLSVNKLMSSPLLSHICWLHDLRASNFVVLISIWNKHGETEEKRREQREREREREIERDRKEEGETDRQTENERTKEQKKERKKERKKENIKNRKKKHKKTQSPYISALSSVGKQDVWWPKNTNCESISKFFSLALHKECPELVLAWVSNSCCLFSHAGLLVAVENDFLFQMDCEIRWSKQHLHSHVLVKICSWLVSFMRAR